MSIEFGFQHGLMWDVRFCGSESWKAIPGSVKVDQVGMVDGSRRRIKNLFGQNSKKMLLMREQGLVREDGGQRRPV